MHPSMMDEEGHYVWVFSVVNVDFKTKFLKQRKRDIVFQKY